MKAIILAQKKRYPQMEAQDLVKLLYQSIYGGGHLITDWRSSLAMLKKEHQEVTGSSGPVGHLSRTAAEDIGGGYCRLHLRSLPWHLSLETLNRMFVLSAQTAAGDTGRIRTGLDLIGRLIGQNQLGFDQSVFAGFCREYQRQGYPLVRHSDIYRKLYAPSYRVLKKEFVQYLQVFAEIDRLLQADDQGPLLVAVDGQCASGKSWLGELLNAVYDSNLIHLDDFFLRPEQRTQQRLAEVGGNVDYERFRTEVLTPLMAGEAFSYQKYDCRLQRLTDYVSILPKKLNIVEGAYSRHPYFGDCYHLTYCLGIDRDKQQERILARNGEVMLERFVKEWIPKENHYLKTFGIWDYGIAAAEIGP